MANPIPKIVLKEKKGSAINAIEFLRIKVKTT